MYITALISLRLAIKFEETQDDIKSKTDKNPYDDIFDKILVEVALTTPDLDLSLDSLSKIIQTEEIYICAANDWNFQNTSGVDFLESLF